ncbi:translation elongation factor EF1B gamma, partial [Ascosphaera pollenicola]
VQTPTQRRANEKYAKHQMAKRGKPETAAVQKSKQKPSVSSMWIVLLIFVVCGGFFLELFKVMPYIWSTLTSVFKR